MHHAIEKRRTEVIESKKALLKSKLMEAAVSLESVARHVNNSQLQKLGSLYRRLSQQISTGELTAEILESLNDAVDRSATAVWLAAERHMALPALSTESTIGQAPSSSDKLTSL